MYSFPKYFIYLFLTVLGLCCWGGFSLVVVSEWVKLLSRVRLFATPLTAAYQAPPSMGFSRQECWSGLPFPSPGNLPDPGIKPGSPALQADSLQSEPPGKPHFISNYRENVNKKYNGQKNLEKIWIKHKIFLYCKTSQRLWKLQCVMSLKNEIEYFSNFLTIRLFYSEH